MRLMLVISEMGIGGAERVVLELARFATNRGDAVAVLADPGRLDRELEALGVTRAPLPHARTPPALARAALSGARLVRSFRPEVIHSHNVRVTALARAAARLGSPRAPAPVLATYHGVPADEARRAARILRAAHSVVCVSSGLRDELLANGVPPDRVSVVENGVPPAPSLDDATRERIDRELGLHPGPVVAAVGRLAPQKAHARFLEAAALVRDEQPDAQFMIVGDGPLRADLEAHAARLGLAQAVHFTGTRDDAPTLIARADILAFSSEWEGLSIAALEALASGVPIVSTEVAGARELLATGAGVSVEHDPRALSRAVLDLIREPDRRAMLGRRGRELYEERFSSRTMAERYARIYHDLLARQRPPRVSTTTDGPDR
jgi:glycosyltransferase involved in cell wall biosynthesis